MLLQINQKHNLKELVELGKFDYKYINSDITELPKAEAEGAKRILNKWQEELRKLEK